MNRNTRRLFSTFLVSGAASLARAPLAHAQAPNAAAGTTEATLYSTMPSKTIHRPEMAFDGDDASYFQSAYGMSQGDDFSVFFSQPLTLRGLRIVSGNAEGDGLLTQGYVETSTDGTNFTRAASFDAKGIASATTGNLPISALRIKSSGGTGSPLILREIALDSPTKIAFVGWGAGRAFSDYSLAPDIKTWAAEAERKVRQSWPDTAALLYSDGFITPNKVNIVYRSGPKVTGVAAVGGGVMEVNIAWARAHPEDTGLTVHEVAHVIQSSSSGPGWLIEGVADYVRWVKFEPQNFTFKINPAKASYRDAYRTTAAFLAWCELHYDARLVSKLNRDTRFGTYSDANFKSYTGKSVDALWSEFLTAYQADAATILTPPLPLADRPRVLPLVTAGTTVAVNVSKSFNALGISKDGGTFGAEAGFDGGGASFSSDLLGTSLLSQNVAFALGAAGQNNIIAADGQVIPLTKRKFSSLWLLGAATDGALRGQTLILTYTDGTTQEFAQNLSDWYSPQDFPGETRALKTSYRNLADGSKDARPFSLYSYGFALDGAKTVQSLILPRNLNLKIAAVSLAN